MKPKFILLCVLVVFSVGFRYTLKHRIIRNANENILLERELLSEKAINKDLLSECNHLQAYSRIVNIARTNLGMIIPANDPEKVFVVQETRVRNRTVSRVFDTFTPSAEALSNGVVITR